MLKGLKFKISLPMLLEHYPLLGVLMPHIDNLPYPIVAALNSTMESHYTSGLFLQSIRYCLQSASSLSNSTHQLKSVLLCYSLKLSFNRAVQMFQEKKYKFKGKSFSIYGERSTGAMFTSLPVVCTLVLAW